MGYGRLVGCGSFQAEARIIMRCLFRKDMLVGLDRALAVVRLGKGISCPWDLHLLNDPEALVNYYPFLLDMTGFEFLEHRWLENASVDFLRKKFHLVPIADSVWK